MSCIRSPAVPLRFFVNIKNMTILRESKYFFAAVRLFFVLHLVSSSLSVFRGKTFIRLLCFDHPSSTGQDSKSCDADSPCDPQFIFCFYNTTNPDPCNLGRFERKFRDTLRRGVCNDTDKQNVADFLDFAVTTNTSELFLRLTINDIDQYPGNLFERHNAIDELYFRLLPTGLPTLPFGQKPRSEDYGEVSIVRRTSKSRGRPTVQLGAVLQCAAGRFGPLCEVECTATDHFGCFKNGSRQCRHGWMGTNCSELDFCAGQPCKSWAICNVTDGGFQCTCDGATGPQCIRGGDPCLNHRCVNMASCLRVSGRPVCACAPGWKGRFCQEKDPCSPNPCGDNGRCISQGALVQCRCARGYSGPACNDTAVVVDMPEEEKRQNGPGKAGRISTTILLFLIILAVVLVAVMVIAVHCFWQHRRAKDSEQHYPSLYARSTQRTTPSTSTSVYDESRLTAEIRLSAEEGVYELPGPLYSVKEEEEEEEAGEDTVFRPSSGSQSIHFVQT